MLFFKKKKDKAKEDAEEAGGVGEGEEEGGEEGAGEDTEGEEESKEAAQPEPAKVQGQGGEDLTVAKLSADVEKLKAQFSTFYELQKATTERFTRVNEQIGELRSMLIQRDKDAQYLEAKATQAIDLVKTVQPEKLMVEVRKEDSKVEALRANIESNEGVMKNIMAELKEIRGKLSMFKGMEEMVQLNDEVKNELMGIKKVNAMVERHADKVETIFSELQKRLGDFMKTQSMVGDTDKELKKLITDVDSMRVKMNDLSSKKEVENLIVKVDNFEKHASNVMSLMNTKFEKLTGDFQKDYKGKMEKTEVLLKGFQTLAAKTPDLDKYFNLLEEEAKKVTEKKKEKAPVEKIKQPGETNAPPPKAQEKEGMMDKVKGVFNKK